MTPTTSLPSSVPAHWPLYRSVAYLRGRGISFGAPILPPQVTASGVYSVNVDVGQNGRTSVIDSSLAIFEEGSLDHIYLGPRINGLASLEILLRECGRKLKVGGHLIVHSLVVSHEPGAQCLPPQTLKETLAGVGRWALKDEVVEGNEALLILKRLKGTSGVLAPQPRSPQPRACVCRFGALGDAIILTPLLRQLHEDGYHVTFLGTPYCAPALENNSNIDNLLLQERDAIPNPELGEYWKYWRGRYDRYINLSESLEGDLLIVEGRKEFFTTKSWRHERCNSNYYDYTLKRGGYPQVLGRRGELFFTEAEERRAKKFWEPLAGRFVILWALNGSSHHKVYPLMEPVMKRFLDEHPSSILITVGDEMARLLEFEHPQAIEKAGKWSIRESLIATKYASVVVGPETMVTNAAGCFPTPKITLLSHSTHENLCKYWEGDYCLAPDEALAPCYPCHMLHYSKESCPLGMVEDTETGQEIGKAPICSVAILPTRVLERLEEVYSTHYQP